MTPTHNATEHDLFENATINTGNYIVLLISV